MEPDINAMREGGVFQTLLNSLTLSSTVQGKLLASLVIILLLWLALRFFLRLVFRRTEDTALRYQWQKTSSTLVFLAGVLVIGRIWFEFIGSLTTFFGLLSAGLAIALKDPLSNMAGWVFIVW
ncbi:MAG: mechanosensitive ion channel, partial [Deltaproteobacteria bacterium]|nr:mechanosensitive ion channel [Deltaproteobacteria bacterium]